MREESGRVRSGSRCGGDGGGYPRRPIFAFQICKLWFGVRDRVAAEELGFWRRKREEREAFCAVVGVDDGPWRLSGCCRRCREERVEVTVQIRSWIFRSDDCFGV